MTASQMHSRNGPIEIAVIVYSTILTLSSPVGTVVTAHHAHRVSIQQKCRRAPLLPRAKERRSTDLSQTLTSETDICMLMETPDESGLCRNGGDAVSENTENQTGDGSKALRIGSFEFSAREFAGSLGDLGTLLPLAIGYIAVCKMNPTGLLVTMGVVNIVMGVLYRLPMPLQPMKVLAIMAIAQAWSPEKIYTSGLVMGVVWLLMSVTGAITWVARWTPRTVVLGIQISLGVMLAIRGVDMMAGSWWLLGIASVVLGILLRKNRFAPAAVVLVLLGLVIMGFKGELGHVTGLGFFLPPLTMFDPREIWPALRDGGLAQIPLTATNAVIATSALISRYWPQRRVTERQLSLNMGVMNVVLPFFGGMPLCHGAGGLAGQYYFGARTGGTNIMEGTVTILLGLVLAGSIAGLFAAFPMAIVGGMLFLVGMELVKFGRKLRFGRELIPVAFTVLGAVLLNMAVGFAVGILVHYLMFRGSRNRKEGPQEKSGASSPVG